MCESTRWLRGCDGRHLRSDLVQYCLSEQMGQPARPLTRGRAERPRNVPGPTPDRARAGGQADTLGPRGEETLQESHSRHCGSASFTLLESLTSEVE